MNSPDFRKLNDNYNIALSATFKSHSAASLKQLDSLENTMNEYAIKAKLPLDNYVCKECDDTGVTQGGIRCECLMRIYRELWIDTFNCGSPIANALLNKLNIPDSAQKSTLTKLYDKCENFINSFPKTNFMQLIFQGGTGVGKTYIVSAIANALIDRDFDVAYCDAYTLNQKFLDHYLGKMQNPTVFMQKLFTADLLIIDDLGSEKIYNNVTAEYLKNIFDMRTNKHTLITTNLRIDSIEFKTRYGDRIHSRLNDVKKSFCFVMTGDDMRLINR